MQLCNAYTELNDPIVQRERFAEQLKVLHMFSRAIQSVLNVLLEIFASLMAGLDVRIENQAMMKQWLWMRHFVRLLNMGCLRLVAGV